ncbi:hypothetical protein [Kaarinaea lacus]
MSLNTFFRLTPFACLAVILSACASRVVVNVNAISDPQVTDYGKRYYLTNVNEDVATNDLYFLEFRRYFDHILKKQGLINSKTRDEADFEIQFQYGISDGRTAVQTYSWPIYETFGGYSVTVTEKITDSEGQTRTVQRTSYVPAYVQRVGSTYETRSYTIYNRYANLAALPIRTTGDRQPTPIWSINIHSVGETSDLRAIMPYLAAASIPFLGRNSGQQQVFELSHDDPTVVELRNLIFTKP